jgi:hypothetical protein
MKPKCAVAASPVVLDMKLNLWYGCPECWKVAGYVQVHAMLGPAWTWHSFRVRINTTDLTPPIIICITLSSTLQTVLIKDFASESTGRGSRASKIDVTKSQHRQDSGQAPSKS